MKVVFSTVTGLLILSAFPTAAFAYIDPGTAGLVLQAIIGGIVGGLFMVRVYWHKLKQFLLRSAGSKDGETNNTEEDQ